MELNRWIHKPSTPTQLARSEVQTTLSWIWTTVTDSISHVDNRYA